MSKIYSFILFILVILTLASCQQIPEEEPVEPITDEQTDVGPTSTCASTSTFGQLTIANLNSKTGYENDSTSITILKDTCAIREGDNTPWCCNQPEILDIDGVDLSAFPPPPTTNNVLAAVEIQPDGMFFPTLDPNSSYPCVNLDYQKRPKLSYDLYENPPGIDPESCGQVCYKVYQYYDNSWQVVGYATPRYDGKWFADAYIKHFSIFALIEMPDPTPIDNPRELFLVIASDFLEDSLENIFVAFYITDDPSGEFSPDEYQHILRFSNPDPSIITMDETSKCSDLPLSDMFSCLFPIGDRIQVVIGVDGDITSHSIISLITGNQVEFYSSSVEYYN